MEISRSNLNLLFETEHMYWVFNNAYFFIILQIKGWIVLLLTSYFGQTNEIYLWFNESNVSIKSQKDYDDKEKEVTSFGMELARQNINICRKSNKLCYTYFKWKPDSLISCDSQTKEAKIPSIPWVAMDFGLSPPMQLHPQDPPTIKLSPFLY